MEESERKIERKEGERRKYNGKWEGEREGRREGENKRHINSPTHSLSVHILSILAM